MTELPQRLHALYAELLHELVDRGADRAWLAPRVQRAVGLVHEAAEMRPPDPRRTRQRARVQRILRMVEVYTRKGYSRPEAEDTVRERLGVRPRTWFRLRNQCHDFVARPRSTIETLLLEDSGAAD